MQWPVTQALNNSDQANKTSYRMALSPTKAGNITQLTLLEVRWVLHQP
jgi:hypothetical protein